MDCPHCGWDLALEDEYVEGKYWVGVFRCSGAISVKKEVVCGQVEVTARTPIEWAISAKRVSEDYIATLPNRDED